MSDNPTWLKLLTASLIITLLSFSLVFGRSKSLSPRSFTKIAVLPTPTPTIIPPSISRVSSGDGTVEAVLQTEISNDGTKTVTLTTSDPQNSYHIFTKALASDSHISLPPNSWSPNNKLFFINEKSGAGDNYLVYKLTGEPFSPDNFLDVSSFWNKTKFNLSIKSITGWAGDNLLQIQTFKPDGSRGQNYWFTTDSHKFLPLAH